MDMIARFLGLVAVGVPATTVLCTAKEDVAQEVRDYRRTPDHGIADLKSIYRYIQVYRKRHNGQYPSPKVNFGLLGDMISNHQEYGFNTYEEARDDLLNPDTAYSQRYSKDKLFQNVVPYLILNTRSDGSMVGGPKQASTRDLLAQTDIYSYSYSQTRTDGRRVRMGYGYWLTLWDDGQVEKIPYDEVLRTRTSKGFIDVFPSEAGVSRSQSVTFQEYWAEVVRTESLPIGKPTVEDGGRLVLDNGGPESVVTFSRLLAFPSRYGIEREELWKHFNPVQEEFSLLDVQAGAAKLNLSLDLKARSLDELQKLNTPAIFLTNDDKRIVVLSQLDDNEAIVIDRVLTRLVARDVLATRYSGQALVAASALASFATAPQVLAEDSVRAVPLPSPGVAVAQLVKISNIGGAPLTLEVERPVPGVQRSELSSATVAPGASVSLSLALRWRTILKSPTQNVLVFVATNDPRRPRLPLAFKLSLPQANPQDAAPANPAKP